MSSWLLVVPPPVLAGLFEWFERPADGGFSVGWLLGKALLALVVLTVLMLGAALAVWAERRVAAWMQGRLGPNRVGPQGLLQPVADLGKFIFKEDMIPGHVNRWMYFLAPFISLLPAMITFAVMPFTGVVGAAETEGVSTTTWASWQIADVDIGVLYILAITSLAVYGIALGGWASNSKYALLGGVRASAQMISYELSLGLAIVALVLTTGSLRLGEMVSYQANTTWFAFQQPLAFFIFLVASYAETNRLPFDMPEAEQEIVAGYHTEYSAMKFAFFFLAEYVNMIVASAFVVTLFCGGWTLFGLERLGWVVGLLIFGAKVGAFVFAFIWVRWTLPRFRYDQLMALGWKWFIPLALGNAVVTAAALALRQDWIVYVLPVGLVVLALVAAGLFPGRRSESAPVAAASQEVSR